MVRPTKSARPFYVVHLGGPGGPIYKSREIRSYVLVLVQGRDGCWEQEWGDVLSRGDPCLTRFDRLITGHYKKNFFFKIQKQKITKWSYVGVVYWSVVTSTWPLDPIGVVFGGYPVRRRTRMCVGTPMTTTDHYWQLDILTPKGVVLGWAYVRKSRLVNSETFGWQNSLSLFQVPKNQ